MCGGRFCKDMLRKLMRFSKVSLIISTLSVISISISVVLLLTTNDRISASSIANWIKTSTPFGNIDDNIYSAPEFRPLQKNSQEVVAQIRSDPEEYRFDWQQWVDLSMVDFWAMGNQDPAAYPRLSTVNSLDSVSLPYTMEMTQHEAALLGAFYVKEFMPAPARVIQLPRVALNNISHSAEIWLVKHRNSSKNHLQYGLDTEVSIYPTPSGPSASQTSGSTPEAFGMGIKGTLVKDVPNSEFRWDPKGDFSSEDEAQMVLQAVSRVRNSGKHYAEVTLQRDPSIVGSHYDWRFFRGTEEPHQLSLTIEALARGWAAFADSFGIDYWLAHGSTLGWWWNGLALPWDTDIDIQVPMKTLHRLAWEFNGSLIVPDPTQANRTFLIDVNPWYVSRHHGNGNNVIDARFIDTLTGSYIDITGLAYLEAEDTAVQCKNYHEYRLDKVVPLMRTLFEGAWMYVPLAHEQSLLEEYPDAEKDEYDDEWHFNSYLRLWENIEVGCENEEDEDYVIHGCFPMKEIPECEFAEFQTCDEYLVDEFLSVENYTMNHAQEMKYWKQLSQDGLNSASAPRVLSQIHDLLNHEYPQLHRLALAFPKQGEPTDTTPSE